MFDVKTNKHICKRRRKGEIRRELKVQNAEEKSGEEINFRNSIVKNKFTFSFAEK